MTRKPAAPEPAVDVPATPESVAEPQVQHPLPATGGCFTVENGALIEDAAVLARPATPETEA